MVRTPGLAACVAAVVLLTACTGGTQVAPPPEAPASTTTTPDAEPTETSTPDPEPAGPLVAAVNIRRPPADLTKRQARRLAGGQVTRWSQLGLPGGRLEVTRRVGDLRRLPVDTVALVPVSAVGPGVRVLSVGGVDPLRDPQAHHDITTMTVVGDIMLGRRVGEVAAAEGDPSYPLRPMQRRLASADITVGNLESTLATLGSPTQGDDSFAADPAVRRGLRAAGFDALSLANNHAGDFGDASLVATADLLERAGLRPFGAGADLAAARRPAIVTRHGVRFGFLGFNAIGETPEAERSGPGAVSVSMPPRTGPLDRRELGRFLGDVRRLAERVDVVTVLPHWGTQYTDRPEPIQREVARQLVRAGADLVVGGHPHWVQGASLVDGALVVHSLGNFTFDMDFYEETMEGLVLEATFWGEELKAVEFVPYRMGADFAPRVVAYDDAERVFANFWRFSGLGAATPTGLDRPAGAGQG